MPEQELILFNEPKQQTLNLHSAAVHIENKVSLLARKSWFYLLYRAFPYLENQNEFSIPLQELKRHIDYDSKDNYTLKKRIEELVDTKISWNINNKVKGEVWGISTLLSHCEIEFGTGVCKYSFSPGLQRRLLNPSMYIKLNLLISKKFRSKHALAIYCIALDYLDIKKNYGEKTFSVEALRKQLGLEDSEYSTVADLNKHILKRAEKSINKESDMEIRIIPQRVTNRRIVGFKITMSIKKDQMGSYLPKRYKKQLAPGNEEYKTYKKPKLVNIENPKLLEFLIEHEISLSYVNERLKLIEHELGFEEMERFLLFLADYATEQKSQMKIRSFPGFYINLIKDDSQLNRYDFVTQKEKEKDIEIEQKINDIFNEKLEAEFRSDNTAKFKKHLLDNFEQFKPVLEKVIEEIKESNQFLRDYIGNRFEETDKKLLDNNAIKIELYNRFGRFGFSEPKFIGWKKTFLESKSNKDKIDKFRKEAERAVLFTEAT